MDVKRALVVSFGPLPACSGQARRLSAALDALGPRLAVDALTAKVEGEPHIERHAGARVLRVPLSGDAAVRGQTFERALRRQLSGEDYDLVLLGDAFGVLPVLQRRSQTPFRLIVDGSELQRQRWPLSFPELEGQPQFRHRLLRLERHALLVADLVLSGGAAQDAALRALGVPQERVRRILPSITLPLFPEAPLPPARPFVVAALGRGLPWEGLEIALQAIALVRREKVAIRLSVAGPLPPGQRQHLRDLADSLDCGEALELRGELPENRVGEFLASAHVCLCTPRPPPQSAGAPLGVHRLVEGLASGRPVIAAEVPTLRELAGSAALYLAGEDPAELAQALLGLAADPARAEGLGRQGRERVRTLFEVGVVRKAWLGLAEELLDPSGVGLPEPSASSRAPRELDSPTLSVEPTHHGVTAPERDDTRPVPPAADEPTHVGEASRSAGSSWFRDHLPEDSTGPGR